MQSSLELADAEAAAVAKSPKTRVSLDDINQAIAAQYTINAKKAVTALRMTATQSLAVLTLHIIVMKNGFTVVGKSAPADERNFDAALGARLAREDAIRQIWPLMGFALRDRLAAEQA